MKLTDSELCLLEQITYISNSLAEKAGISGFSMADKKGRTVGEILACFDETALKQLESENDTVNFTSTKEWAGVIRSLKNSRMKDLVLDNMMLDKENTALALSFTEEGKPEEAIVAFKGTSGEDEWKDNVEGFNKTDTACQIAAFNYIESLPYKNITVTGHSKGGNKAMYVAVKSDKVTRCVSFDGQGFSQEFLEKYWAEIQLKSKNITAYSLSTDFVHALMFPIPNAKQVYCRGYGVESAGENHSPNSFFKTNIDGKIILDKNGNPVLIEVSENGSINMLHEFTTFVLNNATDSDKKQIVEYLGGLAMLLFPSSGKASSEKIINYVFSDQETLALIVAYLVKYMDEYDLSTDDIDKLLGMLGFGSLNELITLQEFHVFGYDVQVNLNLANIITYIKMQLTDDDDDILTKELLKKLWPMIKSKCLSDLHTDVDIKKFWEDIDNDVKRIKTSGGRSDVKLKSGVTRDFSIRTYETLIAAINRIENMGGESVSAWSKYANEEWYSSLMISIAMKGINSYFQKISETNQTCKTKIDAVFNDVKSADDAAAGKLEKNCENLQYIARRIAAIAARINA